MGEDPHVNDIGMGQKLYPHQVGGVIKARMRNRRGQY
jgi:hypothetical protein